MPSRRARERDDAPSGPGQSQTAAQQAQLRSRATLLASGLVGEGVGVRTQQAVRSPVTGLHRPDGSLRMLPKLRALRPGIRRPYAYCGASTR